MVINVDFAIDADVLNIKRLTNEALGNFSRIYVFINIDNNTGFYRTDLGMPSTMESLILIQVISNRSMKREMVTLLKVNTTYDTLNSI